MGAIGRVFGGLAVAAVIAGCGAEGDFGEPVAFTIPAGAGFGAVVDTLEDRGLVESPALFTLFARLRGADRLVRAGGYSIPAGAGWERILDDLVAGRVVTVPMTIPEGWTLAQMAPRIAKVAEISVDSVRSVLEADSAHLRWEVPGPGLEGYLFPDTYRFAEGTGVEEIIGTMVARYRRFWTDERRLRLDSLGMSEREVVTLASIVQAEARVMSEAPRIASVYHNRVRDDWPLQADPTVLYALGGARKRLLFAAMDSVADHPYNTYTRPGLPPGPIGAPGTVALDATLHPEETGYYFFVVGVDGSHVFSETLAEHNRAVAEYRRRRDTTGS